MRTYAKPIEWYKSRSCRLYSVCNEVRMTSRTRRGFTWVEVIKDRMATGNVVIASGLDPSKPLKMPIELGMVVSVKWLCKRTNIPAVVLTWLPFFCVGRRVLNRGIGTISMRHKRGFGVNYGKDVLRYRMQHYRRVQMSFLLFIPVALRVRRWAFLAGHISYDGESFLDNTCKQFKVYYWQRVRRRLGFGSRMFETGGDTYVRGEAR